MRVRLGEAERSRLHSPADPAPWRAVAAALAHRAGFGRELTASAG
jgi:hypothetical protein